MRNLVRPNGFFLPVALLFSWEFEPDSFAFKGVLDRLSGLHTDREHAWRLRLLQTLVLVFLLLDFDVDFLYG